MSLATIIAFGTGFALHWAIVRGKKNGRAVQQDTRPDREGTAADGKTYTRIDAKTTSQILEPC